jgi:DNA-binding response OmpR family regulator
MPVLDAVTKLLLVDDDVDVRESLAEFLSQHGYEVRTACHGEEGLRCLAVEVPDVLLLDIEMPLMNGRAMAVGMMLHDAGLERIPIVLLSGGVELPSVAGEIGTPYYLAKPVGPGVLLSVLERAARERVPAHGLVGRYSTVVR